MPGWLMVVAIWIGGLGMVCGLWLLMNAVNALETMAEVMEISHAPEIEAYRRRNLAMPEPEKPYRQRQGGGPLDPPPRHYESG